jgi:hypothetical protein
VQHAHRGAPILARPTAVEGREGSPLPSLKAPACAPIYHAVPPVSSYQGVLLHHGTGHAQIHFVIMSLHAQFVSYVPPPRRPVHLVSGHLIMMARGAPVPRMSCTSQQPKDGSGVSPKGCILPHHQTLHNTGGHLSHHDTPDLNTAGQVGARWQQQEAATAQ